MDHMLWTVYTAETNLIMQYLHKHQIKCGSRLLLSFGQLGILIKFVITENIITMQYCAQCNIVHNLRSNNTINHLQHVLQDCMQLNIKYTIIRPIIIATHVFIDTEEVSQ
eukprot:232864_1